MREFAAIILEEGPYYIELLLNDNGGRACRNPPKSLLRNVINARNPPKSLLRNPPTVRIQI